MFRIFLAMMTLLPFLSHADQHKEYIVFGCRNAGMFSIFYDVLALCKYYDDGHYNGIQIDFKKSGRYYVDILGENWFEYFCEPIKLGNEENPVYVVGNAPFAPTSYFLDFSTRHEAKRIIDKYIHFRPEIIEEVDQFVSDNFNTFVIGFHYRGTDKYTEAKIVPYEEAAKILEKKIKELQLIDYKIFIATDEQAFLDYMVSIHGDRVCYSDSARSMDGIPLHKGSLNGYAAGFYAIVDSLLLSKTNYLIKMSSNLSDWSTFFNPDLPFIEINERR